MIVKDSYVAEPNTKHTVGKVVNVSTNARWPIEVIWLIPSIPGQVHVYAENELEQITESHYAMAVLGRT